MIFNICVLDDSIMMRKFLGNLCKKFGSVELFDQPKVLLGRIKEGYSPDIILLDLSMPEMHGTEFLEQLKILKANQDIKVNVVSSSDSSNERINKPGAAGCACTNKGGACVPGISGANVDKLRNGDGVFAMFTTSSGDVVVRNKGGHVIGRLITSTSHSK